MTVKPIVRVHGVEFLHWWPKIDYLPFHRYLAMLHAEFHLKETANFRPTLMMLYRQNGPAQILQIQVREWLDKCRNSWQLRFLKNSPKSSPMRPNWLLWIYSPVLKQYTRDVEHGWDCLQIRDISYVSHGYKGGLELLVPVDHIALHPHLSLGPMSYCGSVQIPNEKRDRSIRLRGKLSLEQDLVEYMLCG